MRPPFAWGLVAGLAFLCVDPRAAARDAADALRVAEVTRPATDFSAPEAFERNAGGAATSLATPNANAFSHPSANMSFERQLDFHVGNGIFRKLWVSAPASTQSSDGLGPLHNARSCQSCHIKDGRGRPPREGERAVSMLLALSVPPRSDDERQRLAEGRARAMAEPVYGAQLQNYSVQGVAAEGRIGIAYRERSVSLAGGASVRLLHPRYSVLDPGYGPLDPEVMLSPRVAPQMIGMGLIEAIPDADIMALADPDDADVRRAYAFALLFLQDREGAIAHLREAARLAPHVAAVYLELAGVLLADDQNQAAVEVYETLLARQPKHARANLRLCQAYIKMGRFEQALGYCEDATAHDPLSSAAWLQLGELRYNRRDFAGAAAALAACADSGGEALACWWMRALALYYLGDCAAAWPLWREARALALLRGAQTALGYLDEGARLMRADEQCAAAEFGLGG